MSNKNLMRILSFSFIVLLQDSFAQSAKTPADYVQPFIGSINEGHTMPGPCLPFGSVYPSPNTFKGTNAGYYINEKIIGFAQLHAQGTSGMSAYGNFLLSPQLGLTLNDSARQSKKQMEQASAFYYKVKLKKYMITSEVVPEHNSALYKFTFPANDSAVVMLDIARKTGGHVSLENGNISTTSDGKAMYGGGTYGNNWPEGRHKWNMFFYAEFSNPASFHGIFKDSNVQPDLLTESGKKNRLGAYVGFSVKTNEHIFVKIAVSFISTDHAKQLLQKEIPAWDIEKLQQNAKAKWNNYLSRIKIEGTEEEKTIFYTHMFHAFVQPRNRTGNNLWQTQEDFWDDHYTLWDSWKTLFPLMTIIDQKMVSSNINSFINRFKYNRQLGEAFVNGKESAIGQGGNTVDNVIADAFVKKIKGVDWEKAYAVLKYNADSMRTEGYRNKGYMYLSETNNYSWRIKPGSATLAFSLNDYSIATMANGLGKKRDYEFYQKRSSNWKNIFNSNAVSDGFSGFIMARKANGSFDEIDPKDRKDKHFYEGTCWEYSYEIPQDVEGMIEKMGGREQFVKRLQHAMDNHLIDFGNEPSFMTPWLFAHETVQRADLTSFYIRNELLPLFTRYDLPGDDDQGAMASLFVFAKMGFFPYAGSNKYYLHGASYIKVIIQLENGKQFIIKAPNASSENIYVKSVHLNKVKLNRSYITQEEIMRGGELTFEMTNKPSPSTAKF